MASIHKNGSRKNWFCAFYMPDGTRAYKSTGTSDKRQAMMICQQWEAASRQAKEQRLTMKRARDVIAGIYQNVHGEELPSDGVGEYFGQWIQRKQNELAESSFTDYKNTVEQFTAFIGKPRLNKSLDVITRNLIADFRDHLLTRVSPATVRKNLKILRAAFNDAISEGRMRENPAEGMKMKTKTQSQKRMPFPIEAIERLLECADDEWRGMILAGYYTGARLGDVATMEWDSVNLHTGELHFSTQKTDRAMGIPIAKPLMDYLTSLPTMDTGGPLFPRCCASYRLNKSTSLSGQFYKIMERAGLVEKRTHKSMGAGKEKRTTNKWSFHCLRHSLVSGLKNAGVGDFLAKEIAGHESDAVSRIYSHADRTALRDAINKLPVVKVPGAVKTH